MDERISQLEWIAWGGLALSAFAILEHRAMKSGGIRPTLSKVLRHHTRRSQRRRVVAGASYAAFSGWFAYHILYQELTDEGISKRGF